MSEQIDAMKAELASVALAIARLLSQEDHDAAELAGLDARKKELRAKIKEAEAPARSARVDAACVYRRSDGPT